MADKRVVCIDPGHPSENGSGTRGKTLTELDVAWRTALGLRKELEAVGVTVVMTRDSKNKVVTNRRRAEIGNGANADLVVRLHCDAASSSGFAVYYPDRAGRTAGVTGPTADVIRRSAVAGAAFHAAMAASLKGVLRDRGLLTDRATLIGGKQGALTGSIFSKVPVVLVEMLVLTHPEDEAFAKSKSGLPTLAKALAKATLAALLQLEK